MLPHQFDKNSRYIIFFSHYNLVGLDCHPALLHCVVPGILSLKKLTSMVTKCGGIILQMVPIVGLTPHYFLRIFLDTEHLNKVLHKRLVQCKLPLSPYRNEPLFLLF